MIKMVAAAIIGGLLAAAVPAEAKVKMTFAYVTDPSHEVYFYALRQGLVPSDVIELELNTASIPALTQALLGRQFDVVQASVVAVPRALAQGLDIKILHTVIGRATPGPNLDLWVKKDSPIKSIDELKGQQIGVFGLGSTALALMRVALAKVHGFNVALQGGDFKFVELPTVTIPSALSSNRIAAGALLYGQVYEAQQTGEFRTVWGAGPELEKLSGARMVLPVLLAYSDRLAASPETYREFNRMVTASVRYADAHKKELTELIGKQSNVPPAFLAEILTSVADYKTPVEEADVKAIDFFWGAAHDIGLLPPPPAVRTVIWPDAMKP